MKNFILDLKEKVLNGYIINREEAMQLAMISNEDEEVLNVLFDTANELREHFCGDYFDLCTIMNAKSGQCSEDCKYCAQSSHFKTGVEVFGLIKKEAALEEARRNESEGAHRFSLVTSGRGLKGNEIELLNLQNIYKYVKQNTDKLELCASHGICTKEALQKLKDAGVVTYHHNLESSRRFYGEICTSHTYDDRVNTIKNAQAVGLDVCSGGIFGMGETMEDRIDMAMDLRELNIYSIPINVLTPIKGTPLENVTPITPVEVIKTIAIYRFMMPKSYIRYGAGRIRLGEYSLKGYRAGVNATLTGNFLTTTGTTINEDTKMIREIGYNIDRYPADRSEA